MTIFCAYAVVSLVLLAWFASSASVRQFFFSQNLLACVALLACLGVVAVALYGVVLLDASLLARTFLRSLSAAKRARMANELHAIAERLGETPSTLAEANATEAFITMCRYATPSVKEMWGVGQFK